MPEHKDIPYRRVNIGTMTFKLPPRDADGNLPVDEDGKTRLIFVKYEPPRKGLAGVLERFRIWRHRRWRERTLRG